MFKTILAASLLLCQLPLLRGQLVVYYPDNQLGTPAGNFPWYTGGTTNPVRYQELLRGTFPPMPKVPMLLTKVGWALLDPAAATSATYSTFLLRIGNAGVANLTNTWATNLPDETVRFQRPNFVVTPGGASWWEIELDVPVLYDGRSGLVLDMITAVASPTTFCRASRDDSIMRILLTNYTGQATGSAPMTGGCKLKLTFEDVRGPLGKVLEGAIDLEAICLLPGTATPNKVLLGLDYGPGADPASPGAVAMDYLWISGRRDPANPAGPHLLYQVDPRAPGGAAVVAVHPQPAGTLFSASGLQDLAYDPAANFLYGGTDINPSNPGRLYAFNCRTLAWEAAKDVAVPAIALSCLRALALDPVKRRFWCADLTSPIEEIDLATGSILAAYPAAQHGAKEIRGLGYLDLDGKTPRLWSFGSGTTAAGPPALPGSGVVLREHDLLGGLVPTQVMTFADTSIPYAAGAAGGIGGGMAIAFDEKHRQPVLWCLHQADKGFVSLVSPVWSFGPACPEGSGKVPRPGMAGDAAYAGNAKWALTLGANLASSAAGVLFLGRSDALWFGIPLPLELGSIGLSGCWLNAALDFPLGAALVTAAGASLPAPIPPDPLLAGVDLFFQWVLYDPSLGGQYLTSAGVGVRIK